MANVPLSQRLIDGVKQNAVAPLQAQLDTLRDTLTDDEELINRWRLVHAPAQEIEAAKMLPTIWTEKYNVQLRIRYDGNNFQLNTIKKPFPLNNCTTSILKIGEECAPQYQPVVERFLELYAPWKRTFNDIRQLEQALDTVFDNCATLKQAIAVMPAIETWLPTEYAERHRAAQPKRENTRKSADEIKAEALTPEALAALARARMSQP